MPRGDTGSFYLPVIGARGENDVAVFSVKNPLTQETVIEKIVDASEPYLSIFLEMEDTINLDAQTYNWDVKLYRHPTYDEDGQLIGAIQIDSYYSAFKEPLFILKEVSKSNERSTTTNSCSLV